MREILGEISSGKKKSTDELGVGGEDKGVGCDGYAVDDTTRSSYVIGQSPAPFISPSHDHSTP